MLFFEAAILTSDILINTFNTLYIEKKWIEVLSKINKNIFDKAIHTDYKYFDDPEFYDKYTWTINEYSGRIDASRQLIVQCVTYIITISALIAIIAASDWLIIVITILIMVVSTYLGTLMNKIGYKKNEESVIHNRKMSYVHRLFYIKDWAAGLRSTNVFKYLFDSYDEAAVGKVSIIMKYRVKLLAIIIGINSSHRILNLFIYLYIAFQVIYGKLTIGGFITMVVAAQHLQTNLSNLFNLFRRAQELSIYTDKIKVFFSFDSEIETEFPCKQYAVVPKKAFSIELKNVSFSYDSSNFSIKNVSLSINRGEKIAIVGENGCGKTTLTKLILRFYDPTAGDIFINGISLKEYRVQELRKSIGVAFQSSPIYALSMAKNMSIYNNVSTEKLRNIAKIMTLDRVLEKSNASFESEVTREFDKDGLILSGGEQQKLALSRLFTGDFGLLILDEPTSALDPIAEYELKKIIFNKASETTAIMISHRLSTVRDADCIYLFNNGEIMEKGTHCELMKLSGRYYEMFTKQAEKYI